MVWRSVDKIAKVLQKGVKHATVVGAGFIGVELAENLVKRNVQTTVVERMDQVLPPLDREMTRPVYEALVNNEVEVLLEESCSGFEQKDGKLVVATDSGKRWETDLVLMCVGVRPDSKV